MGMEWMKSFPETLQREMRVLIADTITDVRVFAGRPVIVRTLKGERTTSAALSHEEIYALSQALSGRMLRLARGVNEGYLTLKGGHRLGLCGTVTREREGLLLHEIGSLCLRVAHEVMGCGTDAAATAEKTAGGVMIVGAPGSGKTTILRDTVRQLSDRGAAVGLVDERGEVAACFEGVPQLDVGERTHVLDGCDKESGVSWLLRAMRPEIIAMDELGGESECTAVRAASAAGVKVLMTVHARDAQTLCLRPGVSRLLRDGTVGRVLFLGDLCVQSVMTAQEVLSCWQR